MSKGYSSRCEKTLATEPTIACVRFESVTATPADVGAAPPVRFALIRFAIVAERACCKLFDLTGVGHGEAQLLDEEGVLLSTGNILNGFKNVNSLRMQKVK